MNLSELVSAAYYRLERCRVLLFLAVIALLGSGLFGFRHLYLQENIAAMLPEGGEVAESFRLLRQAPFARKVLISLEGNQGRSANDLIRAADALKARLDPALFPAFVGGSDSGPGPKLLPYLVTALPSLVTEKDLDALKKRLDGGGVKKSLEESYRQLLGPEGIALKGILRHDPLGLHRIALEKLRFLNLVPGARFSHGHLVSPDGRSLLIVAETPVPITDSAGAERLLAAFDQARQGLPAGVRATLVSGHRYTVANARAIRGDLWLILGCSSLALALLFVLFLRSWRAVFVFLTPVSVVCVAAVAVGAVYGEVSAVTIGFGAVLLGIAVDFGLHVYFALRHGGGDAGLIVGEVARPVVFGALTTVGAFAVLLCSQLPGQRQLAVFSIVGISLALLLALLVLPHLLRVGQGNNRVQVMKKKGGMRLVVVAVWLSVVGLGAWQAGRVTVNGDLGAMGLIPAELAADESRLRRMWGDVRGRAMIWSLGNDPDQALGVANEVFEGLGAEQKLAGVVSLSPLLPPPADQERNRRRWAGFWSGADGVRILADFDQEAGALGFAPAAFAPFRESLSREAPAVTPDTLREAGLRAAVDALLTPLEDGRIGVLTLIPETSEWLAASDRALTEIPGARLVAQGRFRVAMGRAIQHDFFRFLAGAGGVVMLLVALLFRHPGKILAALVPVVTGLLVMLGIMGYFGMALNLFNIIAAILVIGLGVDYGIFMVCRQSEGLNRATERAVLVSGLTTLAGFGALVLARHPALHSIGLTVLLGIGAAIPTALWVIPAFYGEQRR